MTEQKQRREVTPHETPNNQWELVGISTGALGGLATAITVVEVPEDLATDDGREIAHEQLFGYASLFIGGAVVGGVVAHGIKRLVQHFTT